jgi:hypothetical protein
MTTLYVVVATHGNATYSLHEFDGTMSKISIIGKRIKAFKRRDGRFCLDDIAAFETHEINEVEIADSEISEDEKCMHLKKNETWHIPEDV